jgi:hypothetical protein
MTNNGAFFEGIGMAMAAIDPAVALILGVVIGVVATLGIQRWSPSLSSKSRSAKADPLSNLFARDTLGDQIARVADPDIVRERKDRAASAVRAKIFARNSARPPEGQTPPHRADRYDHAAVLDHIAKVMRAGTSEDDLDSAKSENSSEWEEVLLLPAPKNSPDGTAKAA